jgi:arylsulfatase A-like enzyme
MHQDRRKFLKTAGMAGASAFLDGSTEISRVYSSDTKKRRGSESRPGEQPNIIYLAADQQKASATSIFGNEVIKLPFWEKMAQQGIAFSQAYACGPVSVPSRGSVFTGVHPIVNQMTCNQHKAPLNLKQLSELLMEAGYYTAVAGHYERKNNLSRGWWEQADSTSHGLTNSYKRWIEMGRKGVGWSSGSLNCSAEESHSYLLAEKAIQMIDAAREARMPLFMHIAFEDPHPPYFAPYPFDTAIDPANVMLPEMGKNDPQRPEWQKRFREECGTDKATSYDIRKMIATYYGQIMLVDSQMQRIYNAMKERDMLNNTWFILASDHGDFAGEKGLFTKCETLYECMLHVPLVIYPPANLMPTGGLMINDLVELVDLFPTILGIAGAEIPDYTQGKDLVKWIRTSPGQPLREFIFAQGGNYEGFLKNTLPAGLAESSRRHKLIQGVRSKNFSYINDPEYGDEAYDLVNDPGELVNIIGTNSQELQRHKAALEYWQKQCLSLRDQLGVIPRPQRIY